MNYKKQGDDLYIGHTWVKDFPDMLQGLSGDVQGDYQHLNNHERIRLGITEIPPEFFEYE